MRLIVLFDTDFEFRDTDIVVGLSKPLNVTDANFIKVDNQRNIDYVDKLEKLKIRLGAQYKDKIIKNAINSSINNFNRNWILPLFRWIDTVDYALNTYNFVEILIVGYTKNIGFLPYYEAEGEIGSKLLYKTSDVLPSLIKTHLESKHYCKISTIGKKSSFFLYIRVFTRRYVLLMYKFIITFIRSIQKTRRITNFSKDIKFIVSTRSIAHTEYMYKFLKKYNNNIIIHAADGFHSGNKNLDFIKSKDLINVVGLYNVLSPKKVLITFFKICSALLKIKKRQYIEIESIKMHISSALKEMIISYFDALIYKESLCSTLTGRKAVLITGEMYTPYAYAMSLLGEETNNKTAQLQTTAMMIRKEPDFFYSKNFLMNSYENEIEFRRLYPCHREKIIFAGSLLIDENELKAPQPSRKLKSIIYFTQPLVEEEQEFKIIDKLIELEEELDFKLHIKLHPRERKTKLERYKNTLRLVNNDLIFDDYIKSFDLAVIRNTSLGTSLILEGIPIITCLLTENAKRSKLNYIDHTYYGTVFHVENLRDKISNYEKLCNKFEDFRGRFISANKLDKGIVNFFNHFESKF